MNDANNTPPVPAATIVVLRQREEMEMFMVVRHHQIDFASGALVYPGGKADDNDFDPRLVEFMDGAAEDQDMRAMQVAAIRESFEECGILLAREAGSERIVSAERLRALEPYRTSLHAGEVSITEFVSREELRLAADALHHFAHWITPPIMPKRFDTHFFLAVAPEDHLLVHDGTENVDSVWITPAQAIADEQAGERTIIFPTLRNVERLAKSATVEAALEEAAQQPIVPVLPWTEKRDDGMYLCIPTDAGYDLTEEKMPERG